MADKLPGFGALPSIEDPRKYVFNAQSRVARGIKISQPFDWTLGFDIELVLGFRKVCKTQEEFFGPRGRTGWGVDRYREIVAEVKRRSIPRFRMPVSDQDGSWSCTGQALAKYASVLNMIETGQWVDISAKDLYRWCALPGGGAYIVTVLKRLLDVGVASEELVPSYKLVDSSKLPPDEEFMINPYVETDAIKACRTAFRSRSYHYIEDSGDWMEDFAWATLLNFGAYFGVMIDSNGDWWDEYPHVPTESGQAGGHALLTGKVLMRDGKRYIAHINSWGTAAGNNGWQRLDETFFKVFNIRRSIFEGWTVQDKPNETTQLMKTNSRLIKVIFPDGSSMVGLFDPAINGAGLISMGLNRGVQFPKKADNPNEPDWSLIKMDGECQVPYDSVLTPFMAPTPEPASTSPENDVN